MARREAPEINAGSMADIAFLLLIFFLVTTTMDVDKGISRKLPPIIEDFVEPPPPIKQKNLFTVLVNSNDDILVSYGRSGAGAENREERYVQPTEIRDLAKVFISNFGKDPSSSDSPQKAIISLQNDRGTSYEMFIAIQNELTAAFTELREEEAMKKHGKKLGELSAKEADEIKDMYPQKISEAEPVNLGG
jgi:biopolymer transport protein ExbD